MSCTLIALIFGSLFNLLTRKFVVVRIPAADAGVGDKTEKEKADVVRDGETRETVEVDR